MLTTATRLCCLAIGRPPSRDAGKRPSDWIQAVFTGTNSPHMSLRPKNSYRFPPGGLMIPRDRSRDRGRLARIGGMTNPEIQGGGHGGGRDARGPLIHYPCKLRVNG